MAECAAAPDRRHGVSRGVWTFGVLAGLCCAACQPLPASITDEDDAVIRGSLARLLREVDENGLVGPADGKRSVAYELCVPRADLPLSLAMAVCFASPTVMAVLRLAIATYRRINDEESRQDMCQCNAVISVRALDVHSC